MTTDVTQTVDVRTPVTTAYNQWTQVESFPEFMNGVESVRQLDDRHTHWVTKVGGVHREFDAEITEQRPDEVIAWRSIDGDLAHAGRVTFEPIATDRTRVTVQLIWEPSGFTEKVGSALGFDERQVKSDVQRFKEFIEDRGMESGAWRGEVPEPQGVPMTTGSVAGVAAPAAAAPGASRVGTGTGTPDVIDLLRQQHEQIMAQFERVRATTGPAKQQEFDQLAMMLAAHEAGEQTVLHPATRATAAGEEVADESVREESHAARELALLRELGVQHPEFDIRFERFHHEVLAHASHEENEEFPKLRESLSPQRLDELGETLVLVQSR